MKAPLPNGEWMYLKGLPLGTTPDELSAYFHQHGLRITPDSISIKDFGRVACAFVSLTPEVILDMFRWSLEGVPPFDGRFYFGIEVARKSASRKAA
jgi:hypothetical protein